MVKPTKSLDIETFRGDTTPIKIRVWDLNGQPFNVNTVNIRWTVRDEFLNIDSIIQKVRINEVSDGIVVLNDANSVGYGITLINEIVILRDVDDTKSIRSAQYPFDVELSKGTNVFTAGRGNLIIKKDMSRNV